MSGKKQSLEAQTSEEVEFVRKALEAYRASKARIVAAMDPSTSQKAYEDCFRDIDALGQQLIEDSEKDAASEEPQQMRSLDGQLWTAVTEDAATYHTLRGPVRVQRKRYRAVRNGPTRCPWEERRGVVGSSTTADLGQGIVQTFATVPAAQAAEVVRALTGHAIGPSRVKRVFAEAARQLREQHQACFEAHYTRPELPEAAKTVVISVDALSLRLRQEGFKQATAATLTLLDTEGNPALWGWKDSPERTHTVRIGEMPQSGKQDVMDRVSQEVQALVRAKPDLALEVLVDGAPDLRNHLQARFPQALHLTDFYHVLEHLGDALRYLFPNDGLRRQTEKDRWAHQLKHKPGTAKRLVRWLRACAQRSDEPLLSYARREVDKHAEYLHRQSAYLDYPEAVRCNAALGSGRVEAACKTLVTQRLKISGASWSRAGGAAVLFVRELVQSARFSIAWAFRTASTCSSQLLPLAA